VTWAMRADMGAGRLQELTATGDPEIAAIPGAAEQRREQADNPASIRSGPVT
jgi:hypothetical protein